MAKVMYARLCKRIKRDKQTGSYSLTGSFVTLELTNSPVSFVLLVYWAGTNETFQQSFALLDADGNLLDQTPATECILREKQANISTAFFHAVFPRAGHYYINVLQDGDCVEAIPLDIREAKQPSQSPPAPFVPLSNPARS